MRNKKLAISIIVFTALLLLISVLTNSSIVTASTAELGQSLGFITIVPTVLAVVLAFITRNVLFSLLIGFLSGVLILGLVYSSSIAEFPKLLVVNLFSSIKDVTFNIDNIEILLLCFVVGGMIEVVKSSGGFEALAVKLTNNINTPRKANLLASLLGCLISFDDYANTLIVGPIMKSITDRVKVSREKLSFIVDSTAAPVSGIALVSSWIGVEVASISKGLQVVGSNANGFSIFISSIPFCFYCLFAISFIFVNSLIGKDFGPMLKAENRARKGQTISKESEVFDEEGSKIKHVEINIGKRIFVAVGGIAVLIIFSLVSFYINGKQIAISSGALPASMTLTFSNIMKAISYADTTNLISLAAILGALFAIIFGSVYKLFTLKDAINSWLVGVAKMGSTVLLLALAWSLADVVNRLGTTYFVVEIISANVNAILVPLLIFASCCIVSCASGSFGCMFVVMPLAIPLAFKMTTISTGILVSNETYLLICVGSVIAGSIFGDHCSPVTDCTILAAAGSGCETMEHCFSQLPYTLFNCLISAICGILFTSLGINIVFALIAGILFQILFLLIVGKKAN